MRRRRSVMAALFCLPATGARAGVCDTALLAALHRQLPPGLDPRAIGAALRAAPPGSGAAVWRAGADLPSPDELPARAAADFAAGRIVIVQGWILSRAEGWACAALD